MSESLPGLRSPTPSAIDRRLDELSERLRRNGRERSMMPAHEAPFSEEIRRYFPGLDEGRMPSEQFKLDRMPEPSTLTGEKKRLYQTSLEFQSLFINMMLKGMRSTLHHENDMLYGGRTQEIFEDFLYDEYSKSYSKTAGFPLAEQIYLQMAPRISERAEDSYEENLKRIPPSVSTDQIQREWKR